MADDDDVEQAALAIRDAALEYVADQRGVRVEDYLTVLAAVTGEAALVSSGVLDIESTDLAPGAAIFGDAINEVLTGDAPDMTSAGETTVAGVLRDGLGPFLWKTRPIDVAAVYRFVAEHVGDVPWGNVALSVPVEHQPGLSPLRAAFEMRPVVEAAFGEPAERHIPCAFALASALLQTDGAIDAGVGLTLALEVTFGMAKMVPMSRRQMAETEAGEDEAGPSTG